MKSLVYNDSNAMIRTVYPVYLVDMEDNSYQKWGHLVDNGELEAFQGEDHKIHEGDVEKDDLVPL